jgi:diacylglycerol kinase (ATP)
MMTDHSPSQTALFKSLRRMQRDHEELLGKLEKTTARLERRKARFHALEAGIADLERRLSEPRREHLGEGAASDGTLRRARLIFNPTSGRDDENNAARLASIVSSLRAHGIEAQVGLKTSGKAARELARKAVRAGHALVVVAAGDGTIGDVASELIGSSVVLGIVPIGTMNNLARSLGVPLGIDEACALIGMGTTRHIDVGRVVSNGSSRAEYFLETVGVGLSAIAAMSGQAFEKRRWSMLPEGLHKYFESKPGTMKVEMDGVVVEASTRTVTVSNAPLMGNNMLAAPGARMDDGFLDVQTYDRMGDASLVKHFLGAVRESAPALKSYRARHVRITSQEPVLANFGSDQTRSRNVIEIEIVPRALSIICGNGVGLSVPVESAPSAPMFATRPPASNAAANHAAAGNGAAGNGAASKPPAAPAASGE